MSHYQTDTFGIISHQDHLKVKRMLGDSYEDYKFVHIKCPVCGRNDGVAKIHVTQEAPKWRCESCSRWPQVWVEGENEPVSIWGPRRHDGQNFDFREVWHNGEKIR